MISLHAKTRNIFGRKTKKLRQQQKVPAILYGEGIKENIALEVDLKEFKKVFDEAGTSSLVELHVDEKNKFEVLIHDVSYDPLTDEIIHADFYMPSTKRKITAEVPLVFVGVPPAEKDLGGNLLKEIQVVEVKGLVQKLPKEIKVDLSSLKTFEDKILIKDLKVPEGVEILREKDEVVALVVPSREEEEEEVQAPQEQAALSAQEEKIEQKQEKKSERE